ncbi:hypothetical protein PHYBOEH_010817 [Phytophthora boehmeriae]|uniref:Tudor domain-containing protein n=1 Tax=Phytophthora boehmeriae TaxID=109152 RepID=A0A8T1VK85_9STRA|nr:hypothetical protein PHYBOEH_010817 [Phytophthora boehmeriae]
MEALAYLARVGEDSDDSDEFDLTGRRPTPLDPEYWRGITHSLDVAPPSTTSGYRHSSGREAHSYSAGGYPPMYHQHYQQQQRQQQQQPRPMTSPSFQMHGHGYGYGDSNSGSNVLMSPIQYQFGQPAIPVSPVTHHLIGGGHGGGYDPYHGVAMAHDKRRQEEWSSVNHHQNYPSSTPPVATPQQLKSQVREAFVRAQAYLDLVPFFQSYDLSFAGSLRLGTLQEALGRMGVMLGDQVLQSIGQLFRIPGSGMVDYVGFARFLELDAQELDNMRSMVAARRSVLQNNGIELGDIFVHSSDRDKGRRSSKRKPEKRSRSSRSSRQRERKRPQFQRGEEIQAIPLGERDYEIGVITRVRPNGMYDIEFDSGLYEKNVEEDSILEISRARIIRARNVSDEEKEEKKASQPKDSAEDEYEPGDRVEARFRGGDRFFAGTVRRCCSGGLYDIEYDDGDVESRVRAKYIQRMESKSNPKSSGLKVDVVSSSEVAWAKGQKVEAQIHGNYIKCTVFRTHADGSCDLELETGELENRIPGKSIRPRSGSSPMKAKHAVQSDDESVHPKRPQPKRLGAESTSSEDSSAQPKTKFRQGQEIEAKRKGKEGYFPGVVARCRLNGSYDIDFENGTKDLAVSAIHIRTRNTENPSKPPTKYFTDTKDVPTPKKFKEGEKVEAQYKGKSKFYPGVISRCRLNGTYDIDYDDGEKETGVAAELIRTLESASKSNRMTGISPRLGESKLTKMEAGQSFRVGVRVEARYMGKDSYFKGTISRVNSDGTFGIEKANSTKSTWEFSSAQWELI